MRDTMDLVGRMASMLKRHVNTSLSKDELVSFGSEGLLCAARSFDPARDVPFRCWAAIRVRGAMLDGIRVSGKTPRRAYERLRALTSAGALQDALAEHHPDRGTSLAPDAADARLSAHLADMATAMALRLVSPANAREMSGAPGDGPTPEDEVGASELRTALRDAIARLPGAERRMMELHYYDDVSMDEAAAELGWSRSWGSRLHARAVAMVRRDLTRQRLFSLHESRARVRRGRLAK